jgi:hypothetical protein
MYTIGSSPIELACREAALHSLHDDTAEKAWCILVSRAAHLSWSACGVLNQSMFGGPSSQENKTCALWYVAYFVVEGGGCMGD